MKSSYVKRARKFMEMFLPYLTDWNTRSIEEAVTKFNLEKHRDVKYYHGLTRRCLVTSDYAVKWDYNPTGCATFGGCENELANYEYANDHGYGYLFATITRIKVNGRTFYVMPRIKKLALGSKYYNPDDLLTEDELCFIYDEMNLMDLHDENWGWLNGRVTLIDYAAGGSC